MSVESVECELYLANIMCCFGKGGYPPLLEAVLLVCCAHALMESLITRCWVLLHGPSAYESSASTAVYGHL